jgi:hypothetical protein
MMARPGVRLLSLDAGCYALSSVAALRRRRASTRPYAPRRVTADTPRPGRG